MARKKVTLPRRAATHSALHPCARCATHERYTIGGACVECQRSRDAARYAAYRAQNPLPRPEDSFWSHVDKSGGPDACWPWTGLRHPAGYGSAWNRDLGRNHPASRESWIVNVGPITEGMWVLHKCDNPPCVNPAHLFLGTQGDNNKDMTAKGRHWSLRKTECARGHPYEGDNVRCVKTATGSRRVCRECMRTFALASYYRRKGRDKASGQ